MIERIITRQYKGAKEPTSEDRRLLDYVGKFRRQLSHMGRLIDDLFDVARLQNGKLTIAMEKADLTKVVERSIEEARMFSNKHTIQFSGPGEELCVKGDEDRLVQVVSNLLNNAVKYSPKSKQIDVRLRKEPAAKGSDRPLGDAVLEVEDHGPGIPPEEVSSLFTRFYQAESGRSTGAEGLGLGLFISKAIVEQHSGTISVESKVGKGTTFAIRLLLVSKEGEKKQRRQRKRPAGAQN
jgi:signal transduction histidine kinase